MKLIHAPHYLQSGQSDCQAACAAMVMDYWLQRDPGCDAERLRQLLEEFSFDFRPESGELPPAITGLVSLAIANSGLSVEFGSSNPDGGGVDGLKFLKNGWSFTQADVEDYAEMAAKLLTDPTESGLSIHTGPISEAEIESAIAADKPVVAIVDLKILKSWPESANHAVVITGIDNESVTVHDPDDPMPHRPYSRELFFAAHYNAETESDSYIVTGSRPLTTAFRYKCWELDGHILTNIRGEEVIIDTGSPLTFLASEELRFGDRVHIGNPPPKDLLETLKRHVSPGISGLIGLDILCEFDVSISLRERTIEFHSHAFPFPESTSLPITQGVGDIPHLRILRGNGNTFDAILDLGARFSYLSISDTNVSFGTGWDFWPLDPETDRFPVRLYEMRLTIAGLECSFTVGNREDVARLPDVEIIGSEILKYFDINIAMRRGLVELRPT